ncbi:MAG TPA: hypothetical protein ENJ00_07820 [Phycisphaerales bacterium]|nr:hypothetical protein [Phycisphaerales bacterium]
MTKSGNANDRGTIYILVLMVSVITTVIGLVGFRLLENQTRMSQNETERDEAMVLAESAVQIGVDAIMSTPSWRNIYQAVGGDVVTNKRMGRGSMSTTLVDDDGDLSDDPSDSVTIVGSGSFGGSTQQLQITLDMVTSPHPALNESIRLGGKLLADDGTMTLENGGTASDQSQRDGRPMTTPLVQIASPVDLPDASLVNTWAALGTPIPPGTNVTNIVGERFDSSNAPFGVAPDPNGIYIIDAGNGNVSLKNCQIRGTLIFINVKDRKQVEIGNDTKLEYGSSGGPTIIVDGDLLLNTGWSIGVQQGLIYCTGDLEIRDNFMLTGLIIAGGDVDVNSPFVSINANPSAVAGPPEGFTTDVGLRMRDASWQRVVQN